MLTAPEREERNRQHQMALAAGSRDPGVGAYLQPRQGTQTVLVHVLKDGFTAFGKVWFYGEEIEVEVNGPRWEDARRWILMDDFQQMALYKKINFRHGPWPGVRTYTAGAGRFEQLQAIGTDGQLVPQPSAEELARADVMAAQRGRGVPMPMVR